MAKKVKKSAAFVEDEIPALFKTEFGVCKKLRIKDAWGTTAFLIKGSVPTWVKDVQVDDYSLGSHPYTNKTLADMVKEKVKSGSLVKVTELSPIAAIAEKVAYILIKLELEEGAAVYMQRVFLDYLQKQYPNSHLKVSAVNDDLPLIVAYEGQEIVAFIAGVCLGSVRILSAEELLEVYKEWSNDVKGINLDNYKQENRPSTG